ncbi:kielin/chordin-like protein [Parasteatoda tepidariorum]|uniref:kielin/chordin-like protein n=1 Tax=Parasteatoda tepidariorum TaxID=114398 RepID=UPI0039BC4743
MDSKLISAVTFWLCVLYVWDYRSVFGNTYTDRDSEISSFSGSQYSNSCVNHVIYLKEENEKLQQELDFFKYKNTELQLEVNSLSGQCGVIQHCQSGGIFYANGDIWYPDPCTTCRCENHRINCYTSFHSSHCELQCNENTCLNGGACMNSLGSHSVQCDCPNGFSGPLCEQSITSCTPTRTGNNCNHNQSIWFFDSYSNQCKSTKTGCFENGSTFTTFEECSSSCLQGTCCYRMKIGDLHDVICQAETMKNCQVLCHDENVEVLGYYPGIKCPPEGCGMIASKVCHTGISLYSPGSEFSFGCDKCECLDEHISCTCPSLNIRREIRDLSYAERLEYQKAISHLYEGKDKSLWTSFRNLYVTHVMHANSPQYFLFWNRYFLRTVERHLQEWNCSITIPYFDFSLDAGNLSSSIIWRPDFFGSAHCNENGCQERFIPNTEIAWTPCITRKVKTNGNSPTMIDLALALTKPDFMKFTTALQGISSYLHNFIGGDMETTNSPFDPIYYSLHAYIDMLFWKWEKRHIHQSLENYGADILDLNLIPFNTKQKFLIDSEKNLCVSYNSEEFRGANRESFSTSNRATYQNSYSSGCAYECGNEEEIRNVLDAGRRIQSVLYNQEETFLKTLPRTCLSPSDLPTTYTNQIWNVQPDDFEMHSNFQPVTMKSELCDKFCFTADIFLSPEISNPSENSCSSNELSVPVCDESALSKCPYYTYAPCRLSLCGNCSLTCHVNNQDIECKESALDFCSPNPCKHGGLCQPSEWPTLPHLITCECQPGFEGQFCEQLSVQRCSLPLDQGKLINGCGSPIKRWYFDVQKQDCVSFFYQGCVGNANNFFSYYACRVSCMIGACCWRYPLFPNRIIGYTTDGYDRYGFNLDGRSKENEKRNAENGFGGSKGIFRFNGLDYQGYDKKGFNASRLDRQGYNFDGYHIKTKFNLSGYNSFGDYDGIIEFGESSYNNEGYNRAGFNCQGNNVEGWDNYGTSNGWNFDCRAMNLKDCQKMEKDSPTSYQVISFTPGKRCEEVNCEKKCGCNFLHDIYSIHEQIPIGCGNCECSETGRISCPCATVSMRKEIRDMTTEDLKRFQDAVKYLALKGHPSIWQNLTNIFTNALPQFHGNPYFLPWIRYYLRLVEMKLQEIDCSVTLPYFEWTMDVGSLDSSFVWQANIFGGNGDRTRNYCVRNHPFKSHEPPYWSACLRRNFNLSVSLPNAVEIEKVLRLQTYEEFNYQIEEISSLFHLFVGGHMATAEAAYDPIFFAHYAFIDKLWDIWVARDPNRLLTYPQDKRYIPLAPFSVLPDDVFLSEFQLCVHYIEITEGAPCTDDSMAAFHDKYMDNSQFKTFDISGYDVDGYDSFGYDRMGYTKTGFSRNSFNRDGLDASGFDEQGFNRYGFDRYGCNSMGFCFPNSLDGSAAIPMPSPWEEFSELGYRPTGFDFHGYDIYGFDSNGRDANNCSYFFNGPFYPIFMKNAKRKLNTLHPEELDQIKTICFGISDVPEWWLNLYWMNRVNPDRKIHISAAVEDSYSPFFGKNQIWLAPTPDERFCFRLYHHSKCDLNKPPIPCPFHTCNSAVCPTVPSARCRSFGCGSCEANYLNVITQKPTSCNQNDCISMDGNIKVDGDVWEEDSCYSCNCQSGLVSCSSIQCETECDHPVVVPGSCCPICDGCKKDNIMYTNGQDFIDAHNPCLKCLCQKGSILCTSVACEPMKPCMESALVTLPGECCPKCSMCGPHQENSHWKESPCHNCTCKGGNVHCTVIECSLPGCQYPARTPGECCRHCEDCEYRGNYVKHSEEFYPESCIECVCQKGNIACQKIDCFHSICKNPDAQHEECCRLCQKDCQYDGKVYEDGTIFQPSFNPCMNCSCEKSIVRCQPIKCPDTEDTCEIPVFPPGGCCPQCPKCTFENKEYTNGQRWKISNDSCETCVCMNGVVMCSERESCPHQTCTHGVKPPGECCSSCIDCRYKNHLVPDKMQFSPPDDPCSRCQCQRGNITCVREKCPTLLCTVTELPAGSCCSVCKGCVNSVGQVVEHGQKWIHHSDICQICSCSDSVTKCERITCKIPCTHPVMKPEVCCPECNGCQVLGRIYQNSEEIPSSDRCRRCVCYGGNMECESVSCPTVTCSNPRKEANNCCPVCDECNFQGLVYKDRERFTPKSDSCYSCLCDKGAVSCERRDDRCNPQCSDPVKLPDQCCPVCDGCFYEGRTMKNKERIIPNSDEPCLMCECLNGNIRCYKQPCPQLNCLNPVRLENTCCEECVDYCMDSKDNNKVHNEGEVWVSFENKCDVCTCKDSIIRCQPASCPPTSCLHPAAPFGVCCPECDHCQFTHRLYRNGQEFTHEDDPCQICKCQNGSVSCDTIVCDPLPCMHPENLEGMCCPICSPEVKCHHLGKTYDAWENVLDPENPCSECVCVDGVFSCHPVLCLNTECSNPQLGHCCESCEGCSYGEKNYLDHATFYDPHNTCRECQCQTGIISCQQKSCSVVPDCLKPIYIEGQCCPVCEECFFKGRLYPNGERFLDPDNPCNECFCEYPDTICELSECSNNDCLDTQNNMCDIRNAECYFYEDTYESGAVFTHPENACEICSCMDGRTTCFERSCPAVRCSHPVQTSCCSVCTDGCWFDNTIYAESQVFANPQNPCNECTCQNGNVTCGNKECPKVDCEYPIILDCCPTCRDCSQNGEIIPDGQVLDYISSNECEICSCKNGNIECHAKTCEEIHCSNPVIIDCCPVCNMGCLYNGQIYDFGSEILIPESICDTCICTNGSIECKQKTCNEVECSNPIIKDCCPVCDSGCSHNGEIYNIGEEIEFSIKSCEICICTGGNIECNPKACDIVHCTDPVIKDCCPVCDSGCFYEGKIYNVGAEFDDPKDICSECACMEGSVYCSEKPCETVTCMNPITDDEHCCLYCPDHCIYNGQRYELDAVFNHESDPCKECSCNNGDVLCDVRDCPPITCLNPAPGECCLECSNCRYHEQIYADNKNFTNPKNPCETCLCSKGQVACARYSCVQCLHPTLFDSKCCPICDGCSFEGRNYSNQEIFISSSNPCDECICKNGTVTCHSLQCSQPICSNPILMPNTCCPICPGCVISGIHFEQNKEFTHPDDVCEKCICQVGEVACKRQICTRNCTHPVPDPCCSMCDDCIFESIHRSNGEVFRPDACRKCECKDGNVHCSSEICPELNCKLRVRNPGQCCETCRGCVYEGNEYESDAMWISTSNPCLSCMCKGGTVSCTNIVCPVECVEPIPVPGLCCPRCPGCERDGVKYKSGERFIPPSKPCDSCVCDSGNIFCLTHECPILINCPEESIKPPSNGECCPTCAAFGSSCTRDQIGQLFYPYPDPCFSCQCSENFMWICSKEFCPVLNCPPAEILKTEKDCCPKCKVCISEGHEVHLHGDSWHQNGDLCNRCFCDYGFIKCEKTICPEINCESNEIKHRSSGECCPICASSTHFSCDYGGSFYENGQSWNPDPCTTCQCIHGKMNCHNERCIPLHCTSDEIPSVDPGQCCPKCIPRPATCLAFGDPHYRTFDGASISFQGTCRYVLTADCYTQKFSIVVENNDRGFNGVSWTHRVVLVLQNASVDLRAGPSVYLRGKLIEQLPYFEKPVLYVEKTGTSVLVTTDVGVQVLWNGDGFVEVTVSGIYRGKTCGLCGNFNYYPEDDMRTPTNQTATSEAMFGNSWKYGEVQPSGCTESVDIDPCSKGGYRIRKMANNKCSILKQSLFAPCHQFIRPEPYFAACVYDVCACSENDECLCDILSTYSQECSKAGVILNWRSEGLCGIHCSEEEGLVFDECGPPCSRTCENINMPIELLASQCFKPCVPGCQCSADKVLHNGRCIRPERCP